MGGGAVCLLSGGLDSTVAFHVARGVREAITFDYGQRAARREIEAAGAIARRASVPHRVIPLPWLSDVTHTALVDRAAPLPRPAPSDLDSPSAAAETARKVWVPNRNGVFVNVAAAIAESIGVDRIVVGFNREEGATFPDNSEAFVAAANAALAFSTVGPPPVRLESPTGALDKVAIVRLGRETNAPLELVWSCYQGGDEPCWTCESCRRLRRALDGAGAFTDWEAGRSRAFARR